jgi:predicted ATPase
MMLKGVSELSDIHHEVKRSVEEEFEERTKASHVLVKEHLENMKQEYKEKVNEKRRHKEF